MKIIEAQLQTMQRRDEQPQGCHIVPLGRVRGENLAKAFFTEGILDGEEVVILRKSDYDELSRWAGVGIHYEEVTGLGLTPPSSSAGASPIHHSPEPQLPPKQTPE